jgi:hypothetical protein
MTNDNRWTKATARERGYTFIDWTWLDYSAEQGHGGAGWALMRKGRWLTDFKSLAEAKKYAADHHAALPEVRP